MRGWFADGLDAADLQKAATLLFRAGVNCGTGPPVRYARIGKAGRSMGKLGLIFGCAGLLAACTGPVRDPATVSMGAPGLGVVGPATGAPPMTGAPPARKNPKAATVTSPKAKSARNQKDRSATHPKAPKRAVDRPAVQKTAVATKAHTEARRPSRPAPEIPLD